MKPKATLHALMVIIVFLSCQVPTPVFSAISNTNLSTYQSAIEVNKKEKSGFKHRAQKFAKSAKQSLKERLRIFLAMMRGEKASTLAKTALFLCIGSIGLIVLDLAVAFSIHLIPLLFILYLAFLASGVLALIVLFGDQNKKSKAIAIATLIIWGVWVLLTVLLIMKILADDTS